MIQEHAQELARASLELGAIKLNAKRPFLWASGYYMPVYNDNRMLLIRPEYRKMIARAFQQIIQDEAIAMEYVAGTSTSGIPHATTLADAMEKPLTYVRDKPKGHGMGNRIEGLSSEQGYSGGAVVLIEDLVSTGGSSIRALEGIREARGAVSVCLSIFSYDLEESRQRFSALQPACRLISILTYPTLLQVAEKTGYIQESEVRTLENWRKNPFQWGQENGFPPQTS